LLGQTWPEPVRRQLSLLGLLTFRLGETRVREILAAYAAGRPSDEVAVEHGVSRWTVLKLVREHGGEVRRRVLNHAERALIVELHDRGLTLTEIAAQIRRSQSTVSISLSHGRPDSSPEPGSAAAGGRRRGRPRRSHPLEEPARAPGEERAAGAASR
jgi:hypothetical protein